MHDSIYTTTAGRRRGVAVATCAPRCLDRSATAQVVVRGVQLVPPGVGADEVQPGDVRVIAEQQPLSVLRVGPTCAAVAWAHSFDDGHRVAGTLTIMLRFCSDQFRPRWQLVLPVDQVSGGFQHVAAAGWTTLDGVDPRKCVRR